MLLVAFALGQEPDDPPNVIYKAVTEIDIDGVLLEAEVYKPEVALASEPRRPRFGPAIKLRENFDDLTAHSVDEAR